MARHDNAKTLKEGFEKGLSLVQYTIYQSLCETAELLVETALAQKGYLGFTGNTQTSYACGIYLDGGLVKVIDAQSIQRKPVRKKIKFGKLTYIKYPYEGQGRGRYGVVQTDRQYGIDTSYAFLRTYRVPKGHMALVMTTGTEYSQWLESVMNINVLTNAYRIAPSIINANWKKIDGTQ